VNRSGLPFVWRKATTEIVPSSRIPYWNGPWAPIPERRAGSRATPTLRLWKV